MPWIIGGPGKSIDAIKRSAKRDEIARSEARIQARRAHAQAVANVPAVQAGLAIAGMFAAVFGVGTIENM